MSDLQDHPLTTASRAEPSGPGLRVVFAPPYSLVGASSVAGHEPDHREHRDPDVAEFHHVLELGDHGLATKLLAGGGVAKPALARRVDLVPRAPRALASATSTVTVE